MLALPLGASLLLLVVGLAKKRWGFVASAIALLYVFSMQYTANTLEARLEAKYPAIPVAQAETADAIVMLSGVFGPPAADGTIPNVGDASERLEASIQLWQHNKAPWLVFTGGRMPWQKTEELESAASARVAIRRGIPADHIIEAPEVANTADEAREVAQLVRKRAWKKLLLVTSANHMPRAAIQFRAAGINFVPFTVDYRVDPKRKPYLLDFLPSARGLEISENVIRELYGSLFYSMTHWNR